MACTSSCTEADTTLLAAASTFTACLGVIGMPSLGSISILVGLTSFTALRTSSRASALIFPASLAEIAPAVPPNTVANPTLMGLISP